ncbi:alpha/beta hydrolase family protein [Polyangium jinanense]|uniref:Alpha/beta fold hydrolase n=1 Tax=Polyangium jinanense TaxID=2829994 RepID=A0A9X3X5H7_9BACT|nr:alpha/beta fold hydrolase [Polyangium jinanense]MDC3955475.1 alpha/beta fold hydrolase [Polyangium jinanense]MDC3981776.1 alpha/beta fold hydrolase [Polyangium jinanense]
MRLASLPLAVFLLGACGSAPPAAPPARVVPKAAPAQDVAAPARPRLPKEEVAVSFDRGLWRLEGTLTLPAREEGERVPAVVIVHGSGPMSRDGVMRGQIGLGFGFQIPVYQRLADALADRGYAVYRYDKRTCGTFNDCSDGGFTSVPYTLLEVEFATTEYVLDAEAALDAVAERPEIDPDRLFFAGHSEGGELVPVLLSDRPRVRAGVMLAPPFHTMTVVLEQQSERVRWSFTMAGQPERADAESRELLAAAQALRQIERGTHLGAPILGQPPGLWESWIELARRAPDLARKLDRPLLVLGGSYDYNVAPSEIESWAKWLDGSSRAPHRVRVLDCVTHALNCITQPDATRIKPDDIGRDISPEVLAEVSRFLDTHAARAKLTEARR